MEFTGKHIVFFPLIYINLYFYIVYCINFYFLLIHFIPFIFIGHFNFFSSLNFILTLFILLYFLFSNIKFMYYSGFGRLHARNILFMLVLYYIVHTYLMELWVCQVLKIKGDDPGWTLWCREPKKYFDTFHVSQDSQSVMSFTEPRSPWN